MKKNTAGQKWIVFAFDETDNTAVTGNAAQITAKVSIDGAAGTVTTDANPTEIEDGYYAFDIDADETNGDYLVILPDSATANVQVVGVPGGVWTQFPQTVDNDSKITTIAADVVNVDGIVPSAAGDAMNLAADAIKAVSYDESTAFPLTAVNGSTLTEAGGDGDHLTAINLPNQTMDIVGSITGNLSGSVGSVSGAVGSVTGAVGSVGAGGIAAATFAADAITAASIATGAIAADAVGATALDNIVVSDLAGIPTSTAKIVDAIAILFMALRNKQTSAAASATIGNDAGATIATAVLSDAAGTFTKAEYA